MVEGLVPAVPPEKFLTPRKANKRQIRPKKFTGCVVDNIVTKSSSNNSIPFEIPRSVTYQYKHSFFVLTVEEWNQLEDSAVLATTIDIFKNKLSHRD